MIDPSLVVRVKGPNLALRLIEPKDADYVQNLRTDSTFNRHLSQVRGTVEDQRCWIAGYKTRETEEREFYYVIERKDGTRCGLVRLYDISDVRFTWGSWILDANKPRKAALESAYLIYQIAFELLDLQLAEFKVCRDNKSALIFHRRFGATETHTDEQDVFFIYLRETFEKDQSEFLKVIEREIQS